MSHAYSPMKQPHLETMRVHFDSALVAVDLSPSSATTVKIATELAQTSGARLVVAHILSPTLMLPSGTTDNVRETISRWLEPTIKKETRLDIEVTEGDVVDEMARLAKRYHADLLVIGTHAVQGAAKLAFGSTAEALFRHMGFSSPHYWTARALLWRAVFINTAADRPGAALTSCRAVRSFTG